MKVASTNSEVWRLFVAITHTICSQTFVVNLFMRFNNARFPVEKGRDLQRLQHEHSELAARGISSSIRDPVSKGTLGAAHLKNRTRHPALSGLRCSRL